MTFRSPSPSTICASGACRVPSSRRGATPSARPRCGIVRRAGRPGRRCREAGKDARLSLMQYRSLLAYLTIPAALLTIHCGAAFTADDLRGGADASAGGGGGGGADGG